jgi:O-antigen/teichoic acid export membrane protein
MSLSVERGAALRAAFLITGSTYITYALSLLVGAVVARALGPEQYGEYAYVVWLSGWLVLVVNNGLNTSGIRFVAEKLGSGSPATASDIHGWLLNRQRASLALVTLAFIGICWWYQPHEWQGALLLFVTVGVISVASRATYLFDISIAKGHGAFHVEAYSTFAVSVANVVGVLVLAASGASLTAYLALFTAASVGLWLYSEMMLRRERIRPTHGALDPSLSRQINRHLLWTILLVGSGVLGSKSIETFLLNQYFGPTEVGFFTIAVALTRGSTDLLVVGFSTILMPTMGRAFGAGGLKRVQVIFCESLPFFLFFGLLLAGAGELWSRAAITLLYGQQYSPVIPVLQVMVVVGGLTLSEAAFGSLLATTGQQSSWAKNSVVSLVLSAIFAFSFIPRFGLDGAIASYALAKLISFGVLAVSVVRAQAIALPLRAMSRITLAAMIAAGVSLPISLVAAGVVSDILAGILYVVVLAGATVWLKTWNRTQVEMMLALSNRLPSSLKWIRPFLETWRDRYAG